MELETEEKRSKIHNVQTKSIVNNNQKLSNNIVQGRLIKLKIHVVWGIQVWKLSVQETNQRGHIGGKCDLSSIFTSINPHVNPTVYRKPIVTVRVSVANNGMATALLDSGADLSIKKL